MRQVNDIKMKITLLMFVLLISGCVKYQVPEEFWLDIDETLPKIEKPRKWAKGTTWGDVYKDSLRCTVEQAKAAQRVGSVKDKISAL